MFEPVGSQSRWRIIYDLLTAAATDEVITYETLGTALGLHPKQDRSRISMAMRRAAKEHLLVDDRAVAPVPNVGYRVVLPVEHLDLAKGQQRRANRALQRGRTTVTHVDMSSMDAATRRAFEVIGEAFAMQMDFNRRFDVRQRRLEDALKTVAERTENTEREIANLRKQLQDRENK